MGISVTKIVAFVYFFVILGGGVNMAVNGPSDFRDFAEDRSQLTNVIYLANALLVCLLFLVRPVNVFQHVVGIRAFVILICVVFVSVSTSYHPFRSMTIFTFFLANIFACFYICSVLKPIEVIRILALACMTSVFLSFVLIIFVPSYGRMTYVFPGAWQGIFIHKNVLGKFATLALVAVLCIRDCWARPIWLLSVFSSVLLAVGSGSATSTMAAFIILGTYLASKKRIYLIFAGASALVVALLSFTYTEILIDVLTDGFEKSSTLSGRTTLWGLSLPYTGTNAFFGYGLGAFWRTPEAESLRAAAGWFVPHAHNGVLELALNVGWIGVAAYFLLFFALARLAVRALGSGNDGVLLFPMFIFLHTVIYSIGEANLMRPNSYTEVMFVVALSSVFKFVIKNQNDRNSILLGGGNPPANERASKVEFSRAL